jgi:hypothetical protein
MANIFITESPIYPHKKRFVLLVHQCEVYQHSPIIFTFNSVMIRALLFLEFFYVKRIFECTSPELSFFFFFSTDKNLTRH